MAEEQAMKWTVSTSATVGAIAKALAAAQLEMGPAIKDKVGNIPGKDGRQGYSYGYATLAACFEAIQPLHKQGIAVTQIPLDGGNGVLVATMLMHESGEWIRGDLWLPVTQQTPQGFGSALTYCRRYGLSTLCGLASDDDDGDAATHGPQKPQARQPVKAAPKAPPPANLGTFAKFCDLVDAAETEAHLNSVASMTVKAHQAGEITDSHVEQIKASVLSKRKLFQPANGGAA
jgi:hypothetical protein